MEDSQLLARIEERTRLLPDMDKRLRQVTENQRALTSRVDRNERDINQNCQDIVKVDEKVDNLKIWDRVWNGINSVVLAVLMDLQTGKIP